MKKYSLLLLAAPIILAGCTRNSFTGRSQLSLVPESQAQTLAFGEYKTIIDSARITKTLVTSGKDYEMVQRVGKRITAAVTQLAAANGISADLDGYNWEYNLIKSDEVNAWCMPGGKIAVYTGLLPITQKEAALAVVMGHEVTHALAKHGSERMSQGMLAEYGSQAMSVALANKSPQTQNIFMNAYGIGSQVGVLLPFSRKNELEADKYGLYLCAMAGYDPQEAIPLWQRMAAASSGSKPPALLSTHPVEEKRIEELQKIMPEALKLYKPAPVTTTSSSTSSSVSSSKTTTTTPASSSTKQSATTTPKKTTTTTSTKKINPLQRV